MVDGGSGETSRGLGETLAVSTFLTVVGSAGDVGEFDVFVGDAGETFGLVTGVGGVGEPAGVVGDVDESAWLVMDGGDGGEIRLAREVGAEA